MKFATVLTRTFPENTGRSDSEHWTDADSPHSSILVTWIVS
jgi:hypothetical protein